MLIYQRMTENPVTATPEMNVTVAKNLMKQQKIHRLPVLDENKKLVGVLSEKDILLATPSPVSTLSTYELNFLMEKITVKKIMTKNPVTIDKNATIEEAARVMNDHYISCLPVMDGEKLVGIVSKTDLFKTMLEMLGSRTYGTRIEILVDNKPGVVANISNAFLKAGLNIITFTVFNASDASQAICLFKLDTSDSEKVRELVLPFSIKVIDLRKE